VAPTVLVTGGTGNLGRHVVQRLIEVGQPVRVASRNRAPVEQILDHEWSTVDYRSRAGLDAALLGVEVVVHCASGSPQGEAESIAALLSSGKRAGIKHLVYISIVGVDVLPLSYYRAKLATEKSLIASGIPWTILRATQFHDLALTLVKFCCRLPIGVVPRGVSLQPVAVGEVALRLVQIVMEPPAGRVNDLGGPEIRTMSELARMYLTSAGRENKVVAIPFPGKLAAGLRNGDGMTPDHGDGMQTFSEFLEIGPGQQ
jgi:uncharacterized protein YbjT (DUF2867 family)